MQVFYKYLKHMSKAIILIAIVLFSIKSSAQEPILLNNNYNLHLLNYAYNENTDITVRTDNLMRFNTKNNNAFVTNTYANFKVFYDFELGLNTKYSIFDENNIANINALISGRFYLTRQFNLVLAGNAGLLKHDFEFNSINHNAFNAGLSTVLYFKKYQLGASLNHLNTPGLPNNAGQIPIKYTAFIRTDYNKIKGLLSYMHQNQFMLNPIDEKYYFDLLNYLGIDMFYSINDFDIGLGYKNITGKEHIASAQIGTKIFSEFYLNYSLGILSKNNTITHLHQLGFYYRIVKRPMGMMIRTIGCPSF